MDPDTVGGIFPQDSDYDSLEGSVAASFDRLPGKLLPGRARRD